MLGTEGGKCHCQTGVAPGSTKRGASLKPVSNADIYITSSDSTRQVC